MMKSNHFWNEYIIQSTEPADSRHQPFAGTPEDVEASLIG
jgi:hypothetical protein